MKILPLFLFEVNNMVETIIYLIVGLLLGSLLLYLCVRPRLRRVATQNQELITQQEVLRSEIVDLNDHKHDLTMEVESLNAEREKAHSAYLILCAESETMKHSIEDLRMQAHQSAKIFEEQTMDIAKNSIEKSMERVRQEYLDAEEEYCQEYQQLIAECVEDMQKQLADKTLAIEEYTIILNELIAKTNSAVEAAKRAEEMRTAADFYRLQLSDIDRQEIDMLRNVAPYLRDKEPLNKVIWKCYYEKPTSDLIGRVVGSGARTGIYKITNLQNQMCYIGQAANIADRWKQHIKRGVGADAPTRNKLYPAMVALGPENFSFEIIEECDRSLLDEREDYWQDYFKAKEFGYSIK